MITIDLSSSVALITGAASGIGRATTLAFARAGASVALLDKDAPGMEETVGQVGEGVTCRTYVLDLRDWRSIAGTVAKIIDDFGHIDILINCAGIADGATILNIAPERWDEVQTINLRAPLLLIQEAGRHIVARGGGAIVNVSSSSAFRADSSSPASYTTTKAALNALTRAAAAAFGEHGVNVNSVAPGVTDTPMLAGMAHELVKAPPLSNLMRRASEPEDIANVILFLCSPLARQITGQCIHVSAGNVV